MMIQKVMITMSCCLLYTLLLLTPAALSLKTRSDKADLETNLEARFDELVTLNEITLTPKEKDYRLSIFTINCLAQSSGTTKTIGKRRQRNLCPGISIDSIYTSEELNHMNGAVMDSNPPPEVQPEEDNTRHKRETEEIPSSYDVRDEVEVSKPAHQKTCGNCYIHTFVSALEIAYTKQTGQLVPFSRQELTDCYYSGCSGGDYRVVTHMMSVMDHLSTPDQYGPYLSQYTVKKFACKAGLTPDSLLDIKVKGYTKVTDETLDHYLYKHGSVMTCLDWKGSESNNCGSLQDVRDEVFQMRTNGDATSHGCSHAVLIVGYTPEYYIVKNSHGVSWGDGGYFKIQRGNNACGIEDNMAVLITEERKTPKVLAPNNCPVERPNYCAESKSCTSSPHCFGANAYDNHFRNKVAKRSVPNMEMYKVSSYRGKVGTGGIHDIIRKKIEERKKALEAAKRQGSRVSQRTDTKNAMVHYRESSSARDITSFKFLADKQQCEDQFGERRCGMMKARGYCSTHQTTMELQCRKTCGMCWSPKETECRDVSESCSQLSLPLCDILYRVRRNCPSRCNTCHLTNPEEFESAVNWIPRQPAGPCNVPDIPNGRVVVPSGRSFLRSGETLNVECDEGYSLTGEEAKCVIQDVFSPDPRVLPACIKIEEDQELVGNGADYMGSRNVSASGRPCLSWSREVFRGSVFGNSIKMEELMNGNHHYCRNLGGSRAVPFCLVDMEETGVNSKGEGATRHPDQALEPKTGLQFCFTHPGCDTCSAETVDYLGTEYCSRLAEDGMCDYMQTNAEKQRTHVWNKCAKSCCQVAGCPVRG